jgi:hypothetical protein
MSRYALFGALLVLAMASAASAGDPDPNWKGPGWYIVAEALGIAAAIESGPFASEAQCNAAKAPTQTNSPDYVCEYLTSDPGQQNPF